MESRVLFLIFTNNVFHFARAGITHGSTLKSQIVIDLHLILNSSLDLILENVRVKVEMVKQFVDSVIPRDLGLFILQKSSVANFFPKSLPQFGQF